MALKSSSKLLVLYLNAALLSAEPIGRKIDPPNTLLEYNLSIIFKYSKLCLKFFVTGLLLAELMLSIQINSLKYAACFSLLSHSSDINNFLESLYGVFENWLNWLNDTESSFQIVDLWLHSFNVFHLSGNFNEYLFIIESLKFQTDIDWNYFHFYL